MTKSKSQRDLDKILDQHRSQQTKQKQSKNYNSKTSVKKFESSVKTPLDILDIYRSIVLATDNEGILTNVDCCLKLLEPIKPITLHFSDEKGYKVSFDKINLGRKEIKRLNDQIQIDAYTLLIKKATLSIFFNLHYGCKKIFETKKSALTIGNLSEDRKGIDLSLDLSKTDPKSVIVDLSVILDDLIKFFPELKRSFEISFESPINNELNYMVGGSAITSGCKALRDKNSWNKSITGKAVFNHRKSNNINSYITHYINDFKNTDELKFLPYNEANQILDKFGVHPALLHLILAVHIYRQPDPLSAVFYLKGTDLIKDLGLHKRSDLRTHQKLNKVLEIISAVRSLIITAKWTGNIRVKSGRRYENKDVTVEVEPSLMWDILPKKITQKDLFGNEELLEIELLFRSGLWLKEFFNQAGKELGKSLYNFATYSSKILDLDPYHEELALRIALLQCTMDYRQYYTVEQWLNENLLGSKDRINKAKKNQPTRKKLTDLWDKTLLALERIGYIIHYDKRTYPEELRPNSPRKPRGYFERLLEAKIKLQPETLIKPQSELEAEVEAIEVKPLPQAQTYSGKKLKEARLKANVTPKQMAKYLKCSQGKIYNAEKRENLSKELFKQHMDAINFIKNHPDKFNI